MVKEDQNTQDMSLIKENVQFRIFPSTDAVSQGVINKGSYVKILNSIKMDNGDIWFQVEHDGNKGWINAIAFQLDL